MSAAREAILRFFQEPPPATPENLGIVFATAGGPRFVDAREVVEITPALPLAGFPGARARGVAFWRGRPYEVRGETAGATNFILLRGRAEAFFVATAESPRAMGRSDAAAVPPFREGDEQR